MKRVYVCLLALIIILLGCSQRDENLSGEQLFYAVTTNNFQGVKEALQKSVDLENLPLKEEYAVFNKKEDRALALAIEFSEKSIWQLILDAGADVNSKSDDGRTYLHEVVEWNNSVEELQLLLEAGANVDEKDKSGSTVVDVWADTAGYFEQAGSVEIVGDKLEMLLSYGAQITPRTLKIYLQEGGYVYGKKLISQLWAQNEKTGIEKDLEYAICGESEKLLRYLSENDISDKESVLRQAVAHCSVDVLKELKEKGCKLTIGQDSQGLDLLHIASKYNNKKVIEYLIMEGADVNSVTEDELNSLTLAAISGNLENIQLLKKHGLDWQYGGGEGPDSWISACSLGTEASINILLDSGIRPTDEEIMYGYGYCNQETLEALLKNKIAYDMPYEEAGIANTGFELLCATDQDLGKKLFEIEKVEITPETLKTIVEYGDVEFVRCVFEKMQRFSREDLSEILDMAVEKGLYDLIEKCITEGADINCMIYDHDGYYDEYHTAMHTASYGASCDILEYLIEHGGDMDIKDDEGNTAYNYAKRCKWFSDIVN